MLKGQKMPEHARLALIERFRNNPPNGWIGARKGMKNSPEHTAKIVAAKKLNPIRYWLGKKHSTETKLKISLSKLGKPMPLEYRKKVSGNGHWRWNPSRQFIRDRRYSVEYKQWRSNVFERDNWTCQTCGFRGGYLEAHHIKSYAKFPELRLDVANGVTLCRSCHALTDNYRARG